VSECQATFLFYLAVGSLLVFSQVYIFMMLRWLESRLDRLELFEEMCDE
jgi:HAMP domain-containing protein